MQYLVLQYLLHRGAEYAMQAGMCPFYNLVMGRFETFEGIRQFTEKYEDSLNLRCYFSHAALQVRQGRQAGGHFYIW